MQSNEYIITTVPYGMLYAWVCPQMYVCTYVYVYVQCAVCMIMRCHLNVRENSLAKYVTHKITRHKKWEEVYSKKKKKKREKKKKKRERKRKEQGI